MTNQRLILSWSTKYPIEFPLFSDFWIFGFFGLIPPLPCYGSSLLSQTQSPLSTCSAHGNASCETRALLGYWRLPGNSIHRVPRLTALLAVAFSLIKSAHFRAPMQPHTIYPFPSLISVLSTISVHCTFTTTDRRKGCALGWYCPRPN